MANINNCDDIIDSRDINKRIEELDDQDDIDEEETEELKTLKALQEEGQSYSPDWPCGSILINDDYFTEYAQQLAEDIGAIDSKADWPLGFIDWETAADALKQDYGCIDFDGTDYWIR